jgi:dethiobiotin synthetase
LALSSVFVTSTGTEVGKTLVSRLIVNQWLGAGHSVGYFKSVASGCEESEWGYRSPDEVHLIEQSDLEPSDVTASFRFEAPLSPDRAAEKEDRAFDIDGIIDELNDFRTAYGRLVIEGIGGVAVPFNQSEDVTDLIDRLAVPVVLVAPSTLGTISYTRTAMHYLNSVQADCRGVMLTPARGREIESINRDHLQSFYPHKTVALLPDLDTTDPSVISQRTNEFLDGCDLF